LPIRPGKKNLKLATKGEEHSNQTHDPVTLTNH
jgi:hypothetical protein